MADELKVVNLPASYPDLVGQYQTAYKPESEVSPTQDYRDIFNNLIGKEVNYQGTDFAAIPSKEVPQTGRYPLFFPGRDNEEIYAQQQSGWEKAYNGVVKMSGTAAATFINGTVGLVYGIDQSTKDSKFSSFYDNPLSRQLNDWTASLEDSYAHYKTLRERNGNWWEPSNLFTGNFLWDGVVKNLGFSIGAMGAGFAWGAALKAIGLTSKLMSTGVDMASKADKVISEAAALPQAQRLATINSSLEGLWNQAQGLVGKGLMKADQAIVATFGTVGEAGIESLNNSQQFRQKMIDDYTAEHGVAPTGDALKEINKYAESVGNWSFATNTALLTATNYIQLPKIFSSTFKGEKDILNKVAFKEGKYVSTLPEKGFGKMMYKAKNIAELFFNPVEGFEEGAQYAIQTGTQNYFGKKALGEDVDPMDDGILKGVKEALTTDEGTLNIFIGAFSGALQSSGIVGMHGFGKGGNIGERGFTGYGGQEARTREQAIKALNESMIKDKMKEAYSNIKASAIIQSEREAAIRRGDILESKDLEFDYAHNFIATRLKYGAKESIDAEIADMRTRAMTDDSFEQLKQEGYASPTDTREAFIKRLDNLQKHANTAKSLYDSLKLKYEGEVNDKGERTYDDLVIDKLTYAATKITNYDDRIPQINETLLNNGILTDDILKDILVTGTPTETATKEAIDKINSIPGATDDQKQDLRDNLKDLVELSMRRKSFIEEYNDIKKNPSKYEAPKPVKPVATPKEDKGKAPKVRIKTKTGLHEFVAGQEYFVGTGVDFTKDSLDAFVPISTFTLVGETADGKIQIKDKSGNLQEISKENFLDLKVSDLSKLTEDEGAKFYYEHRNQRFAFNFGKDRGGKRDGRLQYDNGNVYFVYKDANGKIKRKVVNSTHFVKQPGFTDPIITKIGTVKATKEQAEAWKTFTSPLSIERKKAELAKAREQRLAVVEEIEKETRENLDKITKELEGKQKLLTSTKESIEALQKKIKPNTAKKTLASINASIKQLSELEQTTQEEINTLTKSKQNLEMDISYFESFKDELKTAPESPVEFLEELNDQIDKLKGLEKQATDAITALKDLSVQVVDAIQATLNSLRDTLAKNNPEYLPEVDGALDSIKQGGDVLAELSKIRQVLTDYAMTEDMANTLDLSENKLKEIAETLEKTDTALNEVQGIFKVTEKILDKFKEMYEKLQKEEDEMKQLMEDEKLIEEAVGTAYKGVQILQAPSDYEPNAKKATEIIPRATIGIDEGKPHQKRANRFAFFLNKLKNKDDIRGVYVTFKNQAQLIPGLTERLATNPQGQINPDVDQEGIIALVMVNTKGELVDEKGEVIPDTASDQEKLDRAIYQVYPGEKLQWTSKHGGESMFREGTDKDIVKALTEQYVKWRRDVIENPPDLSKRSAKDRHTIEASFGRPEESADRTSVVAAGLVTTKKMKNDVVIKIPTTNKNVSKGTVSYESPYGMVFVETENGYQKLQNRTHTREEAETIFKVLVQLSKNMLDKKVGIKHRNSVFLYEWLKSVVYWGFPTDISGKPKSAGYNSIFWEKDDLTGKFMLSLSGKGKDFVFTPESLMQNKSLIIGMLEKMYNNTNNSKVKQTDQQYEQIVDINEDGTAVTKTWDNYQTYLLSDKNPDGTVRSAEELPLSTHMRELDKNNPDDVNRTDMYFFTADTVNDFVPPEIKKAKKKKKGGTLSPGFKGSKGKAKPGKKKIVTKKKTTSVFGNKPSGKKEFKLDGKTENTITFPQSKLTVVFKAYYKATKANMKKMVKIMPSNDFDDLMLLMKKKHPGKDPLEALRALVYDVISAQATREQAVSEAGGVYIAEDDEEEIEEEVEEEITDEEEDELEVEEEEVDEEEEDEDAVVIAEDDDDAEALVIEEQEGSDSIFGSKYHNFDDESPFRAIVEEAQALQPEDWNKVEAWIKKVFPHIPFYRLKNVIDATNGRKAWGMFKDGAIYVYENAEIGTAYHEVFHAIWKMATTKEERDAIIAELAKREGTFFDRSTLKDVKYSEATPKQLEELLAEEFRDYVQYKKIPVKPKDGRPFVLKFFAELVSMIKEFFMGPQAKSNTEELFKRIGQGDFSGYMPYEQALSYANKGIIDIDGAEINETADFSLIGITDKQRSEMVQHLTFLTLHDIVQNDKSLFEITSLNKAELYPKLKQQLLSTIRQKIVSTKKVLKSGAITKDQAKRIITNTEMLATHTEAQWNEIVAKFEQYLGGYNIDFDENDNLEITNEDKTKGTDFVDGNKIDHFKKAPIAIKMLLATIPETNEQGKAKLSSIGGRRLLPLSQVYISVMNNVHDATSVEDMMLKLHEMAVNDNDYIALYERLTKDKFLNEGVSLDNIKTKHAAQLLGAFWKTFKKQNPDVKNVFIMENGEVVVGDAALSTAGNQIRDDYEHAIAGKIQEGKSFFKYDTKKKKYIGDPDKVKATKMSTLAERAAFLRALGVEFTDSEVNNLKGTNLKIFKEAADGIWFAMTHAKEIATLNGKVLTIRGRLLELALIRASIDNPQFDSTYFNVSGERTQSYIGVNMASELRSFLSQLTGFTDAEVEGTQYSYLKTDSFARNANVLHRMFDEDGEPRSTGQDLLKVGYVGGTINQKNGKQKQSSKLSYMERLVQEINLNLAGWYLNLVPGDASMEWMVKMGMAVTKANLSNGYTKFFDIFKGYFIDELQLSRETDRNIAPDRKANEMRFFKDILGEKLHNQLMEEEGSPASIYRDNKTKIDAAVLKYLISQRDTMKKNLIGLGVLTKNAKGEYNATNINLPEDMSEDQLNLELEALSANYMIANIDLHKVLYSDPYQYSDELKRIKNFLSPRQVLINNSPKMNAAFNRVWNDGINENSNAITNFTRDFFRSTTYSDVLGVVNMLGYGQYKETDGSGLIHFKAYRNFRIRSGEWNDNEERQFKYDMAWEDVQDGKELSDEMMEIYLKGNPKVRSAYTPIKPIVGGNKANGELYNDMMLDKFALYPLSRRMMTDLNENGGQDISNAIKLYDKMKREDIDYVVFESARKVGAVTLNSPYNENGDFNETPYDGIINVPFSIISVQAEVPSKDVYEVTRGSQVTKLVTMDFMEAGVPIDFLPGKDFNARYKAWYDPKTDRNQSEVYREIKHNQDLLSALMNQGYQSLLRRLGIEEVTVTTTREDGTEETSTRYEIVDFSDAITTLREEVLKREVNENISDAITGFENGSAVLEATPAYHQIRNILYSIADKEIISPKMNGGMKVQIPSTFMEKNRIAEEEINGKKGFTSDVLNLYVENGKNVCEIMIARWFDSPMSDAELLDYLNNTDEGKRILSGISFRTPTQKQNSIDSFRIVRFLPTEFGDSVVVPAAFVEKTGSDFDIDKLSIYLKHVLGGKNPKIVEYLTDSNSTLQQRYYKWVLASAKKDSKKYIKHLAKDEIKALRESFNQQFKEIQKAYKTSATEIEQEEYENLLESFQESREDVLTMQDREMRRLFDEGSKPYWSLSDSIRTAFQEMRNYIQDNNIKGPDEITRYKALAMMAHQLPTTSEADKKHLAHMIALYEQELKVLGASDEQLKQSKEIALKEFRASKATRLDQLADIMADMEDIVYDQEDDFNQAYANELAEMSTLMPISEFEKLSPEKQNTRKALENEFIESGQRLINHPHNRERLLSPNSSKILKGLAEDIAAKTIGQSFGYKNVGNMLNREFMSKLRHAFITGKYAIGIAAVNQTNHSLNQRQPIYIDPSRMDKVSDEDKFWLNFGNGQVRFKDFNRIEVNGEMLPTLSMIRNQERSKEFPEGQDISDLLSQFIDGYVDISKGPWIMELGATPNVASTYMFLVKLGVPIKDVAYFMNQPIIRKYLQNVENAGYSWLFMDSFVTDMQKNDETFKVDDAENKIKGITQIPDTARLYENLDKKSFTEKERIEQQFMLREFLKYAKMANQLFLITQGSNFDTANFNDPYLVFKKMKQLEKAQNTIISSVDDLLGNSFIGDLSNTILKMRDAMAEILRSDRSHVRHVIQQVLEPYINVNDRDFTKLAQKAVNDLFDWAVQTNQQGKDGVYLCDMIEEVLINKGGYAKEIMKFVDEVKANKRHKLNNNHIINLIASQATEKASRRGANNITVRGLDNKVYDQNDIIYGFRELRDTLKGLGKEDMYEKIKMLAVLQSGLSNSKISFTSVLPYEDFEDVYNEILANLDNYDLQPFVDLGVFQRNNWNNDDIVPWKRAKFIKLKSGDTVYNPSMAYLPKAVRDAVKSKKMPPMLTQAAHDREANQDYVLYTWELMDEVLTQDDVERLHKLKFTSKRAKINQKKVEMRAEGDYSYIQKALFRKVYDEFGEPLTTNNGKYFVFKAINGWGEGTRANELYEVEKESKLDNGLLKVKSVGDIDIVDLFLKKGGDKPNKNDNFEDEEQVPTKTLRDGENYTYDQINTKMLEDLGYSPEQIGKILKSIC